MGHLIGKSELLHGRRRVAAADDGDRAAVRNRFGNRDGAACEVIPLDVYKRQLSNTVIAELLYPAGGTAG